MKFLSKLSAGLLFVDHIIDSLNLISFESNESDPASVVKSVNTIFSQYANGVKIQGVYNATNSPLLLMSLNAY